MSEEARHGDPPAEAGGGDGSQPAPDAIAPAAPAVPVLVAAPETPRLASTIDPVDALRARGKHVEIAALLAFLVPGLGHFYLGKRAKGVAAFILVAGLYGAGLGLSKGEAVSLDKNYGHPYAFYAQVGAGLPTGLALLSSHEYEVKHALGMNATPPEDPERRWQTQEYVDSLPHQDEGLLYTMVAGLLNLLLIHDAFCGAPSTPLRDEEDDDLDGDDDDGVESEAAAAPPPDPQPPPSSPPPPPPEPAHG